MSCSQWYECVACEKLCHNWQGHNMSPDARRKITLEISRDKCKITDLSVTCNNIGIIYNVCNKCFKKGKSIYDPFFSRCHSKEERKTYWYFKSLLKKEKRIYWQTNHYASE